MRSAGLDFRSRELVLREFPDPAPPGPGEVLFRVHEAGICGTDRELASFHFGFPPEGESFLTLGHEALGQVIETGPGVAGLEAGDWVVPMVRRPCSPRCPSCARGRRDLCVSGGFTEAGIFGRHGYLRDYAVDDASDLVRIPEQLACRAVLIEPLSVVEKAVETALRIHEPGARTALVLGAGPIGILAAMLFRLRGLEVTVYSMEPPDHPRAKLLGRAGIRYAAELGSERVDIALEAAGSPAAAFAALRALAPLGVCGILGSPSASGEMPFLDLLRYNQAVFGTVNAGPDAFARAVEDLGALEADVLDSMISRERFEDIGRTLATPGAAAAKTVHVVAE